MDERVAREQRRCTERQAGVRQLRDRRSQAGAVVCEAHRGPRHSAGFRRRDVRRGRIIRKRSSERSACARLVLVFSEAANNSDEIKKELSLASRYHIPVMALRIEDVEPSDAFAYELSTRQWIDAFEGWDKSIDALATRIAQVSGGGARLQAAARAASLVLESSRSIAAMRCWPEVPSWRHPRPDWRGSIESAADCPLTCKS